MIAFNRCVKGHAAYLLILLLSIPLALAARGAQATGAAPLTNDDIIKMVQAKFGDNVIVAKIKSSPCKFDTSMDALTKLKAASVSDAVMQAMMEPAGPASPVHSVVRVAEPPLVPGFPSNATVAYKRPDGTFTAVEQCPAPDTKTGGTGRMILTQGFSSIKAKSVYRGAEAPLRIGDRRPTFYVRSNSERVVSLVRLEKKGDHREIEVERAGLSSGTGFREKDRVNATVTRVAEGMLSVIPTQELPNGEYLITFDDMGANAFDFGIAVAK